MDSVGLQWIYYQIEYLKHINEILSNLNAFISKMTKRHWIKICNLQSKSNIRSSLCVCVFEGEEEFDQLVYYFFTFRYTQHHHHQNPWYGQYDGGFKFHQFELPILGIYQFLNISLSTPIHFFSHLFTSMQICAGTVRNQKQNEMNARVQKPFEAFPMARRKNKKRKKKQNTTTREHNKLKMNVP